MSLIKYTIATLLCTVFMLSSAHEGDIHDVAAKEKAFRSYNAHSALIAVAKKYEYTIDQTNRVFSFYQHELYLKKKEFIQAFYSRTDVEEQDFIDWYKNQFDYFETEVVKRNHSYPAVPTPSPMVAPPPADCNTCDNLDFEFPLSGAGEIQCWSYELGEMLGGTTGVTNFTPTTLAGSNSRVTVTSGIGTDPLTNDLLSTVAPGGSYSVRLEDVTYGANAAKLYRNFEVTSASPWYKYRYAAILEDPINPHPLTEMPFFQVRMYANGVEIECARYTVIAGPENVGFKQVQTRGTGDLWFRDWTDVIVPLDDYIGQTITVEFIASDCAWGGHVGYAYLDGDCLNGNLSTTGCISGKRTITAPSGFQSYLWSGPSILDFLDDDQSIEVYKEGDYEVLMIGGSGCTLTQSINVFPECPQISDPLCAISGLSVTEGTCDPSSNTFDITVSMTLADVRDNSVLVIRSDQFSLVKRVNAADNGLYTTVVPGVWADGGTHDLSIMLFADNFISMSAPECGDMGSYTATSCFVDMPFACVDCLSSFIPIKGETYIVSGWVKEDNIASNHLTTYADAKISIVVGATTHDFYAEGQIIDGWQRIYGEFDIPTSGVSTIDLDLNATNVNAYFDDIRVYPKNGSMVSYVYDPISLKLVATLDENNYATLYEYDEEGGLIRVKKETERGIYTVKETRKSVLKN